MLPRRARPKAFTLIEVMIVVAIVGIMAATAISSMNPSVYSELHKVAQIVAGDVGYARSLAVTNNSKYRLKFEVNPNRYILEHTGSDPSFDILPDTPFRADDDPPKRQIVRLADLKNTAMTVRLVAVHALSSTPEVVTDVEFAPNGGTTRIEETKIWLTAGSGENQRYLAVRISAVTGLTWIEDFQATAPALVVEIPGSVESVSQPVGP